MLIYHLQCEMILFSRKHETSEVTNSKVFYELFFEVFSNLEKIITQVVAPNIKVIILPPFCDQLISKRNFRTFQANA